jgi:hypothetical protein
MGLVVLVPGSFPIKQGPRQLSVSVLLTAAAWGKKKGKKKKKINSEEHGFTNISSSLGTIW